VKNDDAVLCRKCETWIGSVRYAGRDLCPPCGRARNRAYDALRTARGYYRDRSKELSNRRFPGDIRRKVIRKHPPLTEEEILEGERIGRELSILDLTVWDQVDLATFGTGAWPMFSERDEEDSDEAATTDYP
jgi:hypothetical protein